MDFRYVISAIDRAKTIAIISHISPDGDTVGTSMALYKALKMYGKQPYIFCDDPISGKISVLDKDNVYNRSKADTYDLSIAVDCADIERLGMSVSEFKRGKNTLVIDHHRTNTKFGKYNLVDIGAAATAQIVTFLLHNMHLLNDDIAKLLYCGLVTDSGGFSFSNVGEQTMKAAAILQRYDIEAHKICDHFLKKIGMNIYKLKCRVLDKAKFYDDDTIGVITFRKADFEATGTDNTATEGIINNIINIIGVKVAVSISEFNENNYKISVRSVDGVDSSKIALEFGGGGHKNAAGFRLSGFYEDVVEKILRAVRNNI